MKTTRVMDDLQNLSRDAQALIEATAGDLSNRAKEARSRLGNALQSARKTCERVQDKAVEGARATDRTIRDHPYQSIGVAFGVGLLLGVLAHRRHA